MASKQGKQFIDLSLEHCKILFFMPKRTRVRIPAKAHTPVFDVQKLLLQN